MRRCGHRMGVTLLEIMVAISLVSVVLVAFADVFPFGYKLNFANLTQSKAAAIATGLAERLANLPMATLQSYEGDDEGAALLSAGVLDPATTPDTTAQSVTNVYWLGDVRIKRNSPSLPSAFNDAVSTSVIPYIQCEEISVTIDWLESRRNVRVSRSVTVTTLVNTVLNQ